MSDTASSPAVTVEKRGSTALVATVNSKMLDDKELKLLSQILDQAAADTAISRIVVNLERVQIVPSLGLGLLLRISQKCGARNHVLVLSGLSKNVRQTFTITKLDRIMRIADNVDAALAS